MVVSTARAKTLCTTSELALVKASMRQEIGKLSAARLRQKQTRARTLRDKWRDQATSQKRASQETAGSRNAAYNKNSAEKADLFDELLERFTARLTKVEAEGDTAGPLGRRRSTRSARSRTHKASRTEARSQLAELKSELKAKTQTKTAAKQASAPVKQASKATAAKPTAAETETPATPAASATRTKAAAKRSTKRSKPPAKRPITVSQASGRSQGLKATKPQQLSARTAAKKDRLTASGAIRVQKNRSAANKRNQGRRDAR